MLQNSGAIAPERIETVAELPYQLQVDHRKGLSSGLRQAMAAC